MRSLELLAPARDADIAVEAIKHGADAVYIGPPGFGARSAASNSLDEIRRVVEFAHIFCAKVYVTVNTIILERELHEVEKMIRELYRIGVDALIVQDMGILRMDIPPIELHASTQCDIRTPEKAKFLQDVGFSQLVLARELTLDEIRAICRAVSVPVEVFVHGALCTSYSGRCAAGFVCGGRSGNRGECTQVCRLKYSLLDSGGRALVKDKYLLSLKDFNALECLESLIEAGVSSFKIEGRLKDAAYVKNIVSAYSRRLDDIVSKSGGELKRKSCGETEISFTPDPSKSFNRGFTSYNIGAGVNEEKLASFQTPKSMGEKITDVSQLNPGDGISFFDRDGNYDGVVVNGIRNGRIIGNRPFNLPRGTEIRRTSDVKWKKLMASGTAERRLALAVSIDAKGITAEDETGARVRIAIPMELQEAKGKTDYRTVFSKLGNTPFRLDRFHNGIEHKFIPVSILTSLRREVLFRLMEAKRATYGFGYRRPEEVEVTFPYENLDYRDNVSNSLAEKFYREHGVRNIEPALECGLPKEGIGKTVMTTRHCILRELGLCLKNDKTVKNKMPLYLESGKNKFRLDFDCARCEMNLTAVH